MIKADTLTNENKYKLKKPLRRNEDAAVFSLEAHNRSKYNQRLGMFCCKQVLKTKL